MSRFAAVTALVALLVTPMMAWLCEIRCADDDASPSRSSVVVAPDARSPTIQASDECAGHGIRRALMLAATRALRHSLWDAVTPVAAYAFPMTTHSRQTPDSSRRAGELAARSHFHLLSESDPATPLALPGKVLVVVLANRGEAV